MPAPRSHLDRALGEAAEAPQPELASFRGLGLPESLVVTLERRGIRVPSPIQARTLPDALAGRDVLGRAQTGSGKTLAFGVPLLARLGRPAVAGRPRALVLVPTRELAEQVTRALAPLAHTLGRSVVAVYGGASIGRQVDALSRGADVVVATPGRLEDLIERRSCSLAEVEATVLDEADFMADLGFLPAVTRILDAVPAGTQRMLFSATLDRGVDRLVERYLDDPAIHAVASPPVPEGAMRHLAFEVTAENKAEVATAVARRPGRTLMFVRTKHGADRLAKRFDRDGVAAGALHGNLSQAQRQRALDAFSAGRVPVLVATDVAARGIHVDDVDLVVHYDPPADTKDYLHRSGRTARAGATGTVLSLVLSGERRGVAGMQAAAGADVVAEAVDASAPAVAELVATGTPVVVRETPPPPAAVEDRVPAGASGRGPRRRPAAGGSRAGSRRPGRDDRGGATAGAREWGTGRDASTGRGDRGRAGGGDRVPAGRDTSADRGARGRAGDRVPAGRTPGAGPRRRAVG